ncbi:MAG: hypothetical protein QXD66_03080 [Candidatus Nezhaarchaeales archaeon]|nr:MAG: hypothetical protein DSO06_01750 [Candidatus Nezhaarchaeota archaeon WYZ-LMO8]TDA36951.1 MAG: hypothetical protein DSO05_01700 [Candidatus Nezhaarchaeota archaeon WYZ-LMO7]
MDLKSPLFPPSLLLLSKRKAISEIVAAIIVFVVTLTVSSISIAFLSQRANLSSNIVLQESKKAMLECLASLKIVDVGRTEQNETTLILYNPSDVVFRIVAVIVGNEIQRVNVVLEPISIIVLSINLPEDLPFNQLRFLTIEGVMISARS